MPTYDYQCDSCGHAWELFQKITESPLRKCPECGLPKARRLFGTGAAIVFKGSGFYQTDYRSESYKKGEKAASEASGKKPEDTTAVAKNGNDSAKTKSAPNKNAPGNRPSSKEKDT